MAMVRDRVMHGDLVNGVGVVGVVGRLWLTRGVYKFTSGRLRLSPPISGAKWLVYFGAPTLTSSCSLRPLLHNSPRAPCASILSSNVYDSHTPHTHDMSPFDFEAMYTNITWHDLSEACKQWCAWYYELYHVSNFRSKEENGFVDIMVSMVSKEQFDSFVTEFPFASIAYSPVLS